MNYRHNLRVIDCDPSPLITPPRGMVRRVVLMHDRPRDSLRAEFLAACICFGLAFWMVVALGVGWISP